MRLVRIRKPSGLAVSAMLTIGAALLAAGLLQTFRLIHLISLQAEGSCDYLPCADTTTYVVAGVFVVISLIGLVVLAAGLVLGLGSRAK
jgi:hypothetical protein